MRTPPHHDQPSRNTSFLERTLNSKSLRMLRSLESLLFRENSFYFVFLTKIFHRNNSFYTGIEKDRFPQELLQINFFLRIISFLRTTPVNNELSADDFLEIMFFFTVDITREQFFPERLAFLWSPHPRNQPTGNTSFLNWTLKSKSLLMSWDLCETFLFEKIVFECFLLLRKLSFFELLTLTTNPQEIPCFSKEH